MPRIVVVGGGVIGSSVAFHAKKLLPSATVTVIERDPSFQLASSALSASSLRMQFSSPVNVQLSLAMLDYMKETDLVREIFFHEVGYLFLACTGEGRATLERNAQTQRLLGADIELITARAELKKMFPWMNVEDIEAASLGRRGEGWFDGFGLLSHLKRRALHEGVAVIHGDAVAFDMSSCGGSIRRVAVRRSSAAEEWLDADWVVNAGGPWAAQVAALAKLESVWCPVEAKRRVVHVVTTPVALPACPLVVDPSGIWFRGDGDNRFLVGSSPRSGDHDPSSAPLPLTPEDQTAFDSRLWPALAHRSAECFDALRLQRSWAGYYEVHPMDHNAIIGPHPSLKNFVFCNGFSGHGLQHAVGAGRGVAEWIASGGTSYKTIDLKPLGFERVVKQEPLCEANVI
jgi:FAD-dependent oxidoreductase domain-containing protein 1